MPGGKSIQSFRPVTTAFHADVAFGSQWNVEPERAGPAICHNHCLKMSVELVQI